MLPRWGGLGLRKGLLPCLCPNGLHFWCQPAAGSFGLCYPCRDSTDQKNAEGVDGQVPVAAHGPRPSVLASKTRGCGLVAEGFVGLLWCAGLWVLFRLGVSWAWWMAVVVVLLL